jgi:hypothetical protein
MTTSLTERLRHRVESNTKRKYVQTEQAMRMKKTRGDASTVDLGAFVVLKVDDRDKSGFVNRGMTGIVVKKSSSGSNSIVVATNSGILASMGRPIYYSPDTYKVMPFATIPEALQVIRDNVMRDGEAYRIEQHEQLTMAGAHSKRYNHATSGRGHCKCKGKCTRACGCRKSKIPCSSSCGCSGTDCGNTFEHKEEDDKEDEMKDEKEEE